MNRIKKFSLAYAFQVFGVIMIFGYPGCSSNIKGQKTDTVKNDVVKKKNAAIRGDDINTAPQVPAMMFSLQRSEAAQINLSYLNFRK